MPARTTSQVPAARPAQDTIENYFLDDDFDDPFASDAEVESNKNKRKEPEGLGIDEEVSVAKRARVPRVKLDESK